jgi:hypothetical protein
MRLLLGVLVLGVLVCPVEAQRNCVKGKPCGNTCIAQNKVCHVGSGAAQPVKARPVLGTAGAAPGVSAVIPDSVRYVGWHSAGLYFLTTCAIVSEIPAAERRLFVRERDAKVAGLKPSDINPHCAKP